MVKALASTRIATGAGVRHVSISEPALTIRTDPTDRMIIFWSEDRPVAHTFIWHNSGTIQQPPIVSGAPTGIRAEEPTISKPTASASVVICTRDRPNDLERCLSSLRDQTLRPSEVIVVDNASRDRTTRDVARSAGVVYVREDRQGLDIARNTGALRSRSDIVVYADDDVLLHPRWLECMVAAFDAPQVAAVTGLVLPAELVTPAQLHFEAYWSFGQGYERHDHRVSRSAGARDVYPAWKVGAGASMAFRREVFDRVGLFDERLDVGQAGCSGDSEYWYRLLANGFVCRYEPSSIAFHFHRRTWDDLSRQIFHYMRGHAAALMVQYERTGIAANRRRALFEMPRWYGRRVLRAVFRRARNHKSPEDMFLKQEILGYFSGLLFYYRAARARSDH